MIIKCVDELTFFFFRSAEKNSLQSNPEDKTFLCNKRIWYFFFFFSSLFCFFLYCSKTDCASFYPSRFSFKKKKITVNLQQIIFLKIKKKKQTTFFFKISYYIPGTFYLVVYSPVACLPQIKILFSEVVSLTLMCQVSIFVVGLTGERGGVSLVYNPQPSHEKQFTFDCIATESLYHSKNICVLFLC